MATEHLLTSRRRLDSRSSLYGLGVTVGDYDNDGYDDLFITALGQNHLFHNNHNGTFTDVTKQAGYGVRTSSAPVGCIL